MCKAATVACQGLEGVSSPKAVGRGEAKGSRTPLESGATESDSLVCETRESA